MIGGANFRPLSAREFPTAEELAEEMGEDDFDDTEPCPACGKGIYEDSEWCPHCGEALVKEAGLGKKSWWVVGVLVVVTVVVVLTSM